MHKYRAFLNGVGRVAEATGRAVSIVALAISVLAIGVALSAIGAARTPWRARCVGETRP